jgi:AcrR family transcriptional regulator
MPDSMIDTTAPPRGRRENRKEQIADTAARLFADKGFHATTIQDLVEATGLQRGALYHYIDAKKDLLFQIHKRFIDPLLEEAHAIEATSQPPEATLRALADALMGTIERYRNEVTVFLREWPTIRDDPMWASVRDARREFEAVINRAIERGVREGTFRAIDTRLATLAFLGMINYAYQWFDPQGRAPAGAISASFCDFFLVGVRA